MLFSATQHRTDGHGNQNEGRDMDPSLPCDFGSRRNERTCTFGYNPKFIGLYSPSPTELFVTRATRIRPTCGRRAAVWENHFCCCASGTALAAGEHQSRFPAQNPRPAPCDSLCLRQSAIGIWLGRESAAGRLRSGQFQNSWHSLYSSGNEAALRANRFRKW